MADANWQKVREVFDAALQQQPEERQNYVNTACGDDEQLLTEVESLFSSHDKSDEFLETPAVAHVADMIESSPKGLASGTRFGRYEVIRQIGIGGMGEVYLAKDQQLDRCVAIKILNEEFSRDESNLKRFVREAKAASALNHPNILVIHEIGESQDTHYIVSEFIEGRTLRKVLTESQMDLAEVLNVAIQIAGALTAAHEAHLVHRDIKPENLMVRPDGYVKVLDFGLAKLSERGAIATGSSGSKDETRMHNTQPGLILGTVNYMSPEQAKGELVDERTDIFSLGVVLYEMIEGRAPFAANSMSETLANLINIEPPPITRSTATVLDELKSIVAKTLRKNKDERYQSMKDVLTDLKDLEIDVRPKRSLPSDENGRMAKTIETVYQSATIGDVAMPRTTSSVEYLVSEIKRHKRIALSLAAGVVVAVATIAYFSYRQRSGEVIDSVAVLPFVNVSANPNTEYLSDGISDSIINRLSRLPNLKVIPFNRVLRYKKPLDAQVVGLELNVRAVLMGTLTQQGDILAISAQLVDVRDNRRLWERQYRGKPSDILSMQEEIARETSEKLRLSLTGEEKKQLAKQNTENTDAWHFYSLGNYYYRQNTKEGFEKSIQNFEEATKLDPKYALAYAGLARTHQFMGSRGFSPPKEIQPKVELAALKALQLDDTLAEAHVSLGASKFIIYDWVGAEKEIKRGLELDPNSPLANESYAAYLRTVKGATEGIPYAIRALELASNPDRGEGAFPYFIARQYDKAIEVYRKTLEKNPDDAHAHILLGEAYVAKGLPEEGLAETQRGMALDAPNLDQTPGRWDRYPLLAYAYAAAGRRGEALKILDEQQRLAKARYVSPYNFAIIYTGLGDKDRAFEWLSKCVEEHTLIIFHLKSRPLFDSLRSDPRYVDLLRRMNLEP
jgi:serine/threonine protein kinase/tetratricopeptide (TPR) repeat protein